MGWSCTAEVSRTLEALARWSEKNAWPGSNMISKDAFFELSSMEFDDGRAEGEVFGLNGALHGKALILPNGTIERMPGMDLASFRAWNERFRASRSGRFKC